MSLDAVVIRGLNHVAARQPWVASRLRGFAGAQVEIDFSGRGIGIAIDANGGFCSRASNGQAPDVQITLPDNAGELLVRDRERLFSAARLSGSAELAETLGFVFRNLEWDFEADLAQVIGDIPARRVNLALKAGIKQLRAGAARLKDNLGEYLTEEQQVLVSSEEVLGFGREVDQLRDVLARLEKRIQRL